LDTGYNLCVCVFVCLGSEEESAGASYEQGVPHSVLQVRGTYIPAGTQSFTTASICISSAGTISIYIG